MGSYCMTLIIEGDTTPSRPYMYSSRIWSDKKSFLDFYFRKRIKGNTIHINIKEKINLCCTLSHTLSHFLWNQFAIPNLRYKGPEVCHTLMAAGQDRYLWTGKAPLDKFCRGLPRDCHLSDGTDAELFLVTFYLSICISSVQGHLTCKMAT